MGPEVSPPTTHDPAITAPATHLCRGQVVGAGRIARKLRQLRVGASHVEEAGVVITRVRVHELAPAPLPRRLQQRVRGGTHHYGAQRPADDLRTALFLESHAKPLHSAPLSGGSLLIEVMTKKRRATS